MVATTLATKDNNVSIVIDSLVDAHKISSVDARQHPSHQFFTKLLEYQFNRKKLDLIWIDNTSGLTLSNMLYGCWHNFRRLRG